MQSVYEREIAQATEIKGRIVQGRDVIVPAPPWTWWARHCWPQKTAAELAAIAGKDERTAKRWLSGEFEPPNAVLAALIQKLLVK